MKTAALALFAIAPLVIGPLTAAAQGRSTVITAQLCSGGTLDIPIPGENPQAPEPCHEKGCHAGSCRKKFDPAQCDEDE